MKEQIQAKFDEDGVSPVIGVILMVAVTVALVALVTVIVFDIGGDVSESPDATVDLAQEGPNVTATVLRNENVDDFKVRASSYNQSLTDGDTYYHQVADGGASSLTWSSAYDITGASAGDSVTVYDELYTDSTTDGVGDRTSSTTYAIEDGAQIQVIAVMSDGSEQVLTTTEYEG